VTLRAASGATLPFVTQNGQAVGDVPPQTLELPHLVLLRNGALSDADERTLIVELTGIDVPPGGVTVTLAIETQHGDPDPGSDAEQRILVWREERRIAGLPAVTRTNVSVTWQHEFTSTVTSAGETIATPTDYYRYEITVTSQESPSAGALYQFSAETAALMENQWIARLPEVLEATPGATPDELVVYYCDMFPFRKSTHEPATWLPRKEVTRYVGAELVPQLVEAFRVQSDEWGFPWYEEWTSYRSEDPERLSVALTDARTWFHGVAPSSGHSAISIRAGGGSNAPFATLADGLVSTFHHELFHNLQRNINQHSGGDGRVGGAQDAWDFFSEGTAVLAASVGQPRGQFIQSLPGHTYMTHANGYLWRNSGPAPDLNQSYQELAPRKAAIYWRFLYEQCGGMHDGVEDPAVGMQVIRRALVTLYSSEVVDVRSSTDLVGALPAVMDRALAGSSCPFQTYEESLVAFARAAYWLRLDGGKCVAPGVSAGCGFYDPYDQYQEPPVSTIAYAGVEQQYRDGIKSSFGIDLVDVHLDPAANGQPLTLEFYAAPGSDAAFNVEIVLLTDSSESPRPQRVPAEMAATGVLASKNSDGRRFYTIPEIRANVYSRLGVVITRLDTEETSDPVGEYTIALYPDVSQDEKGISDRAYGAGS
jgi:hypothetical protein